MSKTAAGPGHNSVLHSDAQARLGDLVQRVENLEEERANIAESIRHVYAEAKGQGFDTKVLRAVIAERRINDAERAEREALKDLYRHALGMLADTPLGAAALADYSATVE